MKILIASLTLPPDNSATANLINRLVGEFQNAGHKVDELTVKSDFTDKDILDINGTTVYYADYAKDTPVDNPCLRRRLFDLRKRISCRMPNFWRRGSYQEIQAKTIYKAMKKYTLCDYDVILCVCAYYGAIEGVLRYKKKAKIKSRIALLQVDPLTDNGGYPAHQYAMRKEYEKMLYDVCDAVFTTPIVYRKCEENGFRTDRVYPVEFPLVCEPEPSLNIKIPVREEGEIRCVFTGLLYPTIRDARYTLELFSKFNDKRIKLYIVGKGQDALLAEYETVLRDRLVRVGVVPPEVSSAYMADADVLVNIGNSVMNQVPSKIFDYISRGKSILNVCKSEECPTLEYLGDYPLAVNITENMALTEEFCRSVEDRIIGDCKKNIPYSEIEERYIKCTPKYVAKQILNGLTQNFGED